MKFVIPFLIAFSAFAQQGGKVVPMEKATFGAGCFWCVEAIFQRLDGVQSVVSGYAGGTKVNPTYDERANADDLDEIEGQSTGRHHPPGH